MLARLLSGIATYSWVIETSIPSIILLGEYPYPSKEDYE